MKKKMFALSAVLFAALGAASVQAQTGTAAAPAVNTQAASPLKMELSQFVVTTTTDANGRSIEKLVPLVGSVQPQQVIHYQLVVSNVSNKTLANVQPSLPVPKGTVFLGVAGSNSNVKTQYSFDGGKVFGEAPLMKTVVEKGVSRSVRVEPQEYTNVRWNIATLQPKQSLNVVLRVKVK